jgi:hypothetical protein
MAVPEHALRAVQVRLKSVSNEGHFIREVETVLHPYLPSHCSGVTEICHISLPDHALQTVHVRFIWVSNEGHFTVKAEIVFLFLSPRALQWGD